MIKSAPPFVIQALEHLMQEVGGLTVQRAPRTALREREPRAPDRARSESVSRERRGRAPFADAAPRLAATMPKIQVRRLERPSNSVSGGERRGKHLARRLRAPARYTETTQIAPDPTWRSSHTPPQRRAVQQAASRTIRRFQVWTRLAGAAAEKAVAASLEEYQCKRPSDSVI